MRGSSSWMPYAAQGVRGFDDGDTALRPGKPSLNARTVSGAFCR